MANEVPYGLSSAIYTRDVNAGVPAMRDLYTGIVYVNAPTIGAEIHLPFGGTKGTGNGHREGGTQVLDVFSEWKIDLRGFSPAGCSAPRSYSSGPTVRMARTAAGASRSGWR